MKRDTRLKKVKRLRLGMFILTILLLVKLFGFGYPLIVDSHANGLVNDFEEVIVEQGDTLWLIAKNLEVEQDIRKTIYQIKLLNDIEDQFIFPGQILKVPAFKK